MINQEIDIPRITIYNLWEESPFSKLYKVTFKIGTHQLQKKKKKIGTHIIDIVCYTIAVSALNKIAISITNSTKRLNISFFLKDWT